jgi:hypothetical protein
MLKCLSKIKKIEEPTISSTHDTFKRKYKAVKTIQDYFRERLRICSICCENYIQYKYRVILKCKHTFHFSCYNKLYIYNHKTCPDCRENIKSLIYKPKYNTLREALADTSYLPRNNRRETIILI